MCRSTQKALMTLRVFVFLFLSAGPLHADLVEPIFPKEFTEADRLYPRASVARPGGGKWELSFDDSGNVELPMRMSVKSINKSGGIENWSFDFGPTIVDDLRIWRIKGTSKRFLLLTLEHGAHRQVLYVFDLTAGTKTPVFQQRSAFPLEIHESEKGKALRIIWSEEVEVEGEDAPPQINIRESRYKP